MNFSVISEDVSSHKCDCVVVGMFNARALSDDAQDLDRASRGQLSSLLKLSPLKGKPGEALTLYGVRGAAADRVMVVGLGAKRGMQPSEFKQMVSKMAAELTANGSAGAGVYLSGVQVAKRSERWQRHTLVRGLSEGVYCYDEMKSKPERPRRPRLRKVQVAGGAGAQEKEEIAQAAAVAEGVNLARDLGNRPSNVCTPTHLAEQAMSLAGEHGALSAQVLDESQMRELGMGCLLSVAAGSRQPAKLIVMEYSGGSESDRPVALIGKGVTFDTGGISIKPASTMDEMKFDMCGAASVLGVLHAASLMRLPMNLVAIIPATENMPDGQATKPGDIVTSMSGLSVEILNTDAEGRLILCDAITYAERFNPEVIIDIATLTGACVVALGSHASGLFSNNDRLAESLLEAGRMSGDRAWRMPLWKEYGEQLKSNFADLANVGGREAGSVTAACFLGRFAKGQHWAHLDIAGSAWRSGKSKGATGRPVPLLCQYLLARCEA